MRFSLLPMLSALLIVGCSASPLARAESTTKVPPPTVDLSPAPEATTETAVLAGGCFWGVQGVFQHLQGVTQATSGYAGGAKETASYEQVGSGQTGHAEAVRVVFDPKQITYGRLLEIYFSVAHDPTELNRQGPDHGTQYRSTVFATTAEQARVARSYIDQLNRTKTFRKPLATTVEMDKPFYPAEAYHQDFLTLNPRHPYTVVNDLPKVENLKQMFPALYREKPVLTLSQGNSGSR